MYTSQLKLLCPEQNYCASSGSSDSIIAQYRTNSGSVALAHRDTDSEAKLRADVRTNVRTDCLADTQAQYRTNSESIALAHRDTDSESDCFAEHRTNSGSE